MVAQWEAMLDVEALRARVAELEAELQAQAKNDPHVKLSSASSSSDPIAAVHVSKQRGTPFKVRCKQDTACAGRGKRRLIRFGKFAKSDFASCRKGKRRQHGGRVPADEPAYVAAEDEPQVGETGIPD